jgi:Tfp pilus assembly protein PilF
MPGDPIELYRLGSEALKRQDTNRAVQYLQSAVRRQPDFQEAQYELARAAYGAANLGLAIRALADALLVSPRLPVPPYSLSDVHYNLAILYVQSQKPGLAREQLERATSLDPRFGLAWLRMSELALTEGDRTGARRAAEKALESDPGLAEAHLLLARLHVSDGDLAAAELAFGRAALYEPGLNEARYELARLLLSQQRPAEALACLDPAPAPTAADADRLQLRAEALEALGLPRVAAEARGLAEAVRATRAAASGASGPQP